MKNYNNVTGDISFYIYDVKFKVGNDDATAENAVTVKANPSYGDTWADILTLKDGLKAVLLDETVTEGFSLDVTGSPDAGSQTYNVLFNGTIGGKTYTDHVVATGTVDVAKKELTVSAGDFKVSKEYDGTKDVGASSGELEISGLVGEDSVTINADSIGSYSSENVGTSNVTVTISLTDASGNYTLGNTTVSVPAEITPMSITPTVEVTGTYTYTGSAITPTVTVKDGTTALVKDTDYTVTASNNINAGTATVTIKPVSGGNYTFAETTKDFTIDKATPSVTAPTANTGLVYKGTAQELISAGSTDFGTMVYSLTEDGEYSTTIPTATDAGSYTVYYKVQGNANVNDAAANTVAVSIGKAAVTITANSCTVKVGNTLPKFDYKVSGLVNNETLPITVIVSCTATDSNTEGTYPITVSGADESANYTFNYVNGTLKITSKETQTITADDVTLTYGDAGKKIGATTNGDGAISYAVASGDDVISVAADGTITALKAGTATVEITAAETDDYAAATKTVSVTVNKKKVAVPTADSTEYTYNGKAQTYGVVSTADYTVTGGTQTNAGTYPITITLNDENYEWDGVLGTHTHTHLLSSRRL